MSILIPIKTEMGTMRTLFYRHKKHIKFGFPKSLRLRVYVSSGWKFIWFGHLNNVYWLLCVSQRLSLGESVKRDPIGKAEGDLYLPTEI